MVKDLEGIVFRLIRQLQDLLECIYSHFLYLTIFYFIFVLYFLWHTNFLFLLGFQLQLTAQFPSSSLHIRTTPPLLSTPTVLFVTHFISTLPMQHTFLVFPPRILFLDCFILKKEALRSFETSGTTCPKTRGSIPDDVNLLLFRN